MSPSQRFGAGSFFFFNSKGFLLLIKKERGVLPFQKVLLIPRDLDGIQTHDLQNRNLTLYSAKLQGQNMYNLQCTIYNLQFTIFSNPHMSTPAPSLRGKSDVDNIGVCVRDGRERPPLPYIVTLITYTTAAGIAIRDESNLSSIPP